MQRGLADTFWECFVSLSATGPDLLSAVCQHMSNVDRKSLHSVNRAMRMAMNATVTSISCSERTLPTHQELHQVFPNLASMAVSFAVEPDGFGGPRLNVDEWRGRFQQLASSSELLLKKLRHLSLAIYPANMTEVEQIQPILELLTR
jgi:hypothetical protein